MAQDDCVQIARASDSPALFEAARRFVLPFEAMACPLMQKVERHEKSVYALLDDDGSGKRSVCGVFSFNGTTMVPLFPHADSRTVMSLASFFRDASVSCVSGDSDSVRTAVQSFDMAWHRLPDEERQHLLMRYEPVGFSPAALQVRQCTASDVDRLLPLHVAFLREEVVPSWEKADAGSNAPLEARAVASAVEHGTVFACEADGLLVSKAQISACSRSCALVGGVYTEPSARRQGAAGAVVHALSRHISASGKTAVLFVRQQNAGAYRLYREVGYVPFARHTIAYYRR